MTSGNSVGQSKWRKGLEGNRYIKGKGPIQKRLAALCVTRDKRSRDSIGKQLSNAVSQPFNCRLYKKTTLPDITYAADASASSRNNCRNSKKSATQEVEAEWPELASGPHSTIARVGNQARQDSYRYIPQKQISHFNYRLRSITLRRVSSRPFSASAETDVTSASRSRDSMR